MAFLPSAVVFHRPVYRHYAKAYHYNAYGYIKKAISLRAKKRLNLRIVCIIRVGLNSYSSPTTIKNSPAIMVTAILNPSSSLYSPGLVIVYLSTPYPG